MDLEQANFEGLDLSGLNLRGAELANAKLEGANLSEAKLVNATLYNAKLEGANLSKAELVNAELDGAKLRGANLSRADLSGASLLRADLTTADIHRATFYEVKLQDADFTHVKNAHTARKLETTSVLGADSVKYFETCIRPRHVMVDWEWPKIFGRLPLFGVSYTVLIMVPIMMYALAFYNEKVTQVSVLGDRAERLMQSPKDQSPKDQSPKDESPKDESPKDESPETVTPTDAVAHSATRWAKELKPLAIPSQAMFLLTSTVFLAFASTIYAFACPSRIKEFSRDQWCDQMDKSLIHYWPLAWKRPIWRLVCFALYIVGGAGMVWVICCKVWTAGQYIWEHGAFTLI